MLCIISLEKLNKFTNASFKLNLYLLHITNCLHAKVVQAPNRTSFCPNDVGHYLRMHNGYVSFLYQGRCLQVAIFCCKIYIFNSFDGVSRYSVTFRRVYLYYKLSRQIEYLSNHTGFIFKEHLIGVLESAMIS